MSESCSRVYFSMLQVAHVFLKQLTKLIELETQDMPRLFMQYVFTQLSMINSQVDDIYDHKVMTMEDFLQLMSPRVLELIQILHTYKPDDNFVILVEDNYMDALYDSEGSTDMSDVDEDSDEANQSDSPNDQQAQYVAVKRAVTHQRKAEAPEEEGLSGVIFVERRHTAFALNKLIVELCNWDPDLFFVQSHHITGGVSGGSSNPSQGKETSLLYKKQEDVLKKFRQKELNLLVSTSILEEGIDLPKCNLVIKFDLPSTYRSYVQSKVNF